MIIFLTLSIVKTMTAFILYINIIIVCEFRIKIGNSEYSCTCIKANIILCCYATLVSLNRKCFRKQEGKIIIAFHNGYYDIIHSFLLFSITNKWFVIPYNISNTGNFGFMYLFVYFIFKFRLSVSSWIFIKFLYECHLKYNLNHPSSTIHECIIFMLSFWCSNVIRTRFV